MAKCNARYGNRICKMDVGHLLHIDVEGFNWTDDAEVAIPHEDAGRRVSLPDQRPAADEPLTKREKFAAMALQGLLANAERLAGTTEEFAIDAAAFADALIAELGKGE